LETFGDEEEGVGVLGADAVEQELCGVRFASLADGTQRVHVAPGGLDAPGTILAAQ
jgi:hypothetical protein